MMTAVPAMSQIDLPEVASMSESRIKSCFGEPDPGNDLFYDADNWFQYADWAIYFASKANGGSGSKK